MGTLAWVALVLAAWFVLLAVLTFALVRRSRSSADRRTGGDRRIGLPDTRAVRTERRRGGDRRGRGTALA